MMNDAAQDDYELIFHVYAIGPAGIQPECNGKTMSSMQFKKGSPIGIRAIGEDQGISSIASIEFDFTAKNGAPASPLGDGKDPHYIWYPGTAPVMIGQTDGKWTFTAKLVDKKGKHHALPDPEFQVGDGVGAG